jgi:DNA-binding IscR family transcriptional regulator
VPNCCNGPGACALKDVFDEVNGALYSAMNNISLEDIADRQRTKQTDHAPMYHI